MPATTESILTALDRVYEQGDPTLVDLLDTVRDKAKTDPSDTDVWAHEVWATFKQVADEAHVADRIPGTVGWKKRQEYGTLKQRGRRPTEYDIPLTEKQHGLLSDVDLSRAVRCEIRDDRLVFVGKTPIVRALRKSINSGGLDGHSRRSLSALMGRVKNA